MIKRLFLLLSFACSVHCAKEFIKVSEVRQQLMPVRLMQCFLQDEFVRVEEHNLKMPVKEFFDNFMHKELEGGKYEPLSYLEISFGSCASFKGSTMQELCDEFQLQDDDCSIILTYHYCHPKLGKLFTFCISTFIAYYGIDRASAYFLSSYV